MREKTGWIVDDNPPDFNPFLLFLPRLRNSKFVLLDDFNPESKFSHFIHSLYFDKIVQCPKLKATLYL